MCVFHAVNHTIRCVSITVCSVTVQPFPAVEAAGCTLVLFAREAAVEGGSGAVTH